MSFATPKAGSGGDSGGRHPIPWRLYLILLILAVLLGAGLNWFWSHFDRAERKVPVSGTEQSRRNPWLGLEQFLQRSGVDVRHLSIRELWSAELPEQLTLVSESAHLSLDPAHQERLVRWLMAGGHLIIPLRDKLGENESSELGGLLSRWQISLHRSDREYDPEPWLLNLDAEEDSAFEDAWADEQDAGPVDDAEDWLSADENEDSEVSDWADDETAADPNEIAVHFLDAYYLLSESDEVPEYRMTGYDGDHILTYALGHGRVTVLSDGGALRNSSIQDHDHAWFYYQLSGAAEGRPQWFSDGPLRQGLWSWLWQQAWPLWVSLALFLLLVLWRANLRWGPPLPAASTQRRHLGEHLQASADFLWRQKQLPALWEAEIQHMIQRAGRAHGPLLTWPRPRQLTWILAHSPLTAAEQSFVLRCLGVSNERPLRIRAREFLLLAQLLQRLRQSHWDPATDTAATNPASPAMSQRTTESSPDVG